MSTPDDGYILQSPIAFEKFFKEKYRILCSLAFRYTNNIDVAEEIVQDIFVKIWERRSYIEVKGSLMAYLAIAVKNACINYSKHQQIILNYEKNELKNIHEEYALDYEQNNTELEALIFNAIQQLPPRRKQIFLLSRINRLKYHEIAEKLHLSIKTVEVQMGLALKQLRNALKDYLP